MFTLRYLDVCNIFAVIVSFHSTNGNALIWIELVYHACTYILTGIIENSRHNIFVSISDIVIIYYVYHYCIFSSWGQWMEYRCRIGLLYNSSTASGRGDPEGTVGPSYSLGRRDFFFL